MKLCKDCAIEAKELIETCDVGLVASYLGDAVREALADAPSKPAEPEPIAASDALIEGAAV